jgi:hypothetical protein
VIGPSALRGVQIWEDNWGSAGKDSHTIIEHRHRLSLLAFASGHGRYRTTAESNQAKPPDLGPAFLNTPNQFYALRFR